MIAMVRDGVCALQTQSVNACVVSGQGLQVGDFCLSEVAGDVCNFIHARPAIRDTYCFSLYGHGRQGRGSEATAFAVTVHSGIKKTVLWGDVPHRGTQRHIFA
jgi:hypothetical protein